MPFVTPHVLPTIQPGPNRQQVNVRDPFALQIADAQIDAIDRGERPQRVSLATPRAHKRKRLLRESVVDELPGLVDNHERVDHRFGFRHPVRDIRKNPGDELVIERVTRHRKGKQRFAAALAPGDKAIPDLRIGFKERFGVDEH